jgi:uncharacterized membrane protein
VDTYRWLLALHVSGAFLLVGGGVVAGTFAVAAERSERPREIATFLGLVRFAVPAIGLGAVATLGFGLWLVAERDYSVFDAWILLSVALWVAGMVTGQVGGTRDRETRLLAERLAAEGAPAATPELRERMRDPVSRALSWGSGLAMVAVLALMIWKPGA